MKPPSRPHSRVPHQIITLAPSFRLPLSAPSRCHQSLRSLRVPHVPDVASAATCQWGPRSRSRHHGWFGNYKPCCAQLHRSVLHSLCLRAPLPAVHHVAAAVVLPRCLLCRCSVGLAHPSTSSSHAEPESTRSEAEPLAGRAVRPNGRRRRRWYVADLFARHWQIRFES
jgi:hypothetical protein